MSRNTGKVGLFDLDGSLANFEGGMKTELEKLRSPEERPLPDNLWDLDESEGSDHLRARMSLIKRVPGWWVNLDPIPMGFKALMLAQKVGFDAEILTKGPVTNSLAWKEKIEWCKKHPETKDLPVHIVASKGSMYGRLLYDDYVPFMEEWLCHRPRGLGVMPVTAANKSFYHPQVLKWTGENGEELLSALRAAFQRVSGQPLSW
jgi:5'-nucleotidase